MQSSGIHTSSNHFPGAEAVSPERTKIISKLQMKVEHQPLDPAQVILSRLRLEPARLPIVSRMRQLSAEQAAQWQSLLEGKKQGQYIGRLGNRVVAFIEPDEDEQKEKEKEQRE